MFIVPVVDYYLSSQEPKKSKPLVDWAAFDEWEDSLPLPPPAPRVVPKPAPVLVSEPVTTVYQSLLESSPVVAEEKGWWEDDSFWRKWKDEEKTKSAEAKKTAQDLLCKFKDALLEESERVKAEEARKKKAEEEAKALKDAAVKAVPVPVAVPAVPAVPAVLAPPATPAPVPQQPTHAVDILGVQRLESDFLKTLENGNAHRKTNVQCRDMWKEASMAVSTLAGSQQSVSKSAKRLGDILSRAQHMGPEVVNWLACVAADKIVGQCNIHTKQLVWAQAYLLRTVAETHPQIIRMAFLGAIAKKAPFLLQHDAKSTLAASGMSEADIKDAEVLCRLLLAVLCVCGNLKILKHWLAAQVACAISPQCSTAVMVALKLFCFLDIAAFDYVRLDKAGSSLIDKVLRETLPAMRASLSNNPTRQYYIDCCTNFAMQAASGIPAPDGMDLSANKEADLDPNI